MNLHSTESLILGLLAVVALMSGLAKRFSISYPIILVIVGLISASIPGIPSVRLSPDLVFLVFLPPLLFAAAWQTSWREFRFNLVSISMLAIGLVFFTAFGVAFAARWFLPGFGWKEGFLLGAVVSTTDAVAASSIARHLGLPRYVITLLEGESLANDATGLLALTFGVAMLVPGKTPSLIDGSLQLFWLLLGGIGVGIAFGALGAWLETCVDDAPIAIAASFVVAYGVYFAGELAHASGVIAVVACGLYMSRRSSGFFSPVVRLQANAVWDTVEFALNGFVFVLIGLQLPYVLEGIRGLGHLRAAMYGLLFSCLLIVLRLSWMYPSSAISFVIRRHLLKQKYEMPNSRMIFILGWTGMRGVVALAAAGSLPYRINGNQSFEQRNLIVFLTFVVILVTLVLQGLSLPSVIRLLGFAKNSELACEDEEARRLILGRAIEHLTERRDQSGSDLVHIYDDVLHQYEHRLDAVAACDIAAKDFTPHSPNMQTVLLDAVQTERQELIWLRDSGRIGDEIFRPIERELDLIESRFLSATQHA